MEKKDYFRLEEECEFRFRSMGPCYHLCTGEDSPLLFHNEESFRVAMDIVAFTLALFPDITVLTFEVMRAHVQNPVFKNSMESDHFSLVKFKLRKSRPCFQRNLKAFIGFK